MECWGDGALWEILRTLGERPFKGTVDPEPLTVLVVRRAAGSYHKLLTIAGWHPYLKPKNSGSVQSQAVIKKKKTIRTKNPFLFVS